MAFEGTISAAPTGIYTGPDLRDGSRSQSYEGDSEEAYPSISALSQEVQMLKTLQHRAQKAQTKANKSLDSKLDILLAKIKKMEKGGVDQKGISSSSEEELWVAVSPPKAKSSRKSAGKGKSIVTPSDAASTKGKGKGRGKGEGKGKGKGKGKRGGRGRDYFGSETEDSSSEEDEDGEVNPSHPNFFKKNKDALEEAMAFGAGKGKFENSYNQKIVEEKFRELTGCGPLEKKTIPNQINNNRERLLPLHYPHLVESEGKKRKISATSDSEEEEEEEDSDGDKEVPATPVRRGRPPKAANKRARSSTKESPSSAISAGTATDGSDEEETDEDEEEEEVVSPRGRGRPPMGKGKAAPVKAKGKAKGKSSKAEAKKEPKMNWADEKNIDAFNEGRKMAKKNGSQQGDRGGGGGGGRAGKQPSYDIPAIIAHFKKARGVELTHRTVSRRLTLIDQQAAQLFAMQTKTSYYGEREG